MDNNKDSIESQNESISGESCTVVNAEEVQSINLNGIFSKENSRDGWKIIIKQDCEITINYQSSMRKTDISMVENDQIEKTGDTIFFIKKQAGESYKEMRTSSPLAMELDKVRTSSSPVSEDIERKSPVPPPPQQEK